MRAEEINRGLKILGVGLLGRVKGAPEPPHCRSGVGHAEASLRSQPFGKFDQRSTSSKPLVIRMTTLGLYWLANPLKTLGQSMHPYCSAAMLL